VNAATITRQSKSNLALAFISLGASGNAISPFSNAFCPSSTISLIPQAKLVKSECVWRNGARCFTPRPGTSRFLLATFRQLIAKSRSRHGMLEKSCRCRNGPEHARYPSFEELRIYCYRVASAVGLVSIEIFGYRNLRCKQYAIELGWPCRSESILRDVAE